MGTYAISQAQINLAVANGFTNGTLGAGAANQPATSITWYQAAAFVNWLNTSQGYAAAYKLDAGATAMTLWQPTDAGYNASNLYRNANAHYFLPSEDEWYKAGYYDPPTNGGAGGYWQYATGSNAAPAAVASGTAAGKAVYNQPAVQGPAAVNNAGGLSPYGTMAQSGNVYEWQEGAYDGDNNAASENRAFRNGPWGSNEGFLQSSFRGQISGLSPASSGAAVGFRVASFPEPSCILLVFGSGLMFLARRRRRSSL